MKIVDTLLIGALVFGAQADTKTITFQNDLNGYSGCSDRALFEKKAFDYGGKWGGSMSGTFPEMQYHGEDADDGEAAKLAFGQLIC